MNCNWFSKDASFLLLTGAVALLCSGQNRVAEASAGSSGEAFMQPEFVRENNGVEQTINCGLIPLI